MDMYRNGHVEIAHYDVPKLSSQNTDVPKTICTESVPYVPKRTCTELDLTHDICMRYDAKAGKGSPEFGVRWLEEYAYFGDNQTPL